MAELQAAKKTVARESNRFFRLKFFALLDLKDPKVLKVLKVLKDLKVLKVL